MPRYSEERKAAVLKKLLPPQNRSVVLVAREEGISDGTLYSWLKQCREQGVPSDGGKMGMYKQATFCDGLKRRVTGGRFDREGRQVADGFAATWLLVVRTSCRVYPLLP